MSDTPKLAEVKTIFEVNMRDIPAMLRLLANQIEAGTQTAEGVLCIIDRKEGMQLRGWGAAANFERQALLALRAGEWLSWQAIPPVDAS